MVEMTIIVLIMRSDRSASQATCGVVNSTAIFQATARIRLKGNAIV